MENLNLIIVLLLLVVVVNAIFSAILFSRGLRNIFNILFGLISFGVAAWSIAISGFYSEALHSYTNWLAWTHSSALFIPLVFVYFSNVFPEKLIKGKLFYLITALPFLAILYYLFTDHAIVGKITGLEYEIGPGYIYYQIILIAYFLAGYCLLFLQYRKNKEPVRRQQIKYILIGSITASMLGMITDLIFPFLGIFNYTWLGPIFTVILVVSIFIAILRYHLFNIKVIITEFFSLIVLVILIVDAFSTGAENILILGIKSVALVIITIFLYFFIRGVYKTEKLAKELEVANKRQEDLLHLMNHDVKKPLSRDISIFASILDGSYGSLPPQMKDLVEEGFKLTRADTQKIIDFLNDANLKTGEVKYASLPFDLRRVVELAVQGMKKELMDAKVELKIQIESDKTYLVKGDEEKFSGHVLGNLLKNLTTYARAARAVLSLVERDGKILLSLKDSGIGITSDDMKNLFTKGGKGAKAVEINKEATGEGLYDAKMTTEVHGGKIWAESEGAGKGSTFFVELPAGEARLPVTQN